MRIKPTIRTQPISPITHQLLCHFIMQINMQLKTSNRRTITLSQMALLLRPTHHFHLALRLISTLLLNMRRWLILILLNRLHIIAIFPPELTQHRLCEIVSVHLMNVTRKTFTIRNNRLNNTVVHCQTYSTKPVR